MTLNQSYSHFEIARDAISIVYTTITYSIWHATSINSRTRLILHHQFLYQKVNYGSSTECNNYSPTASHTIIHFPICAFSFNIFGFGLLFLHPLLHHPSIIIDHSLLFNTNSLSDVTTYSTSAHPLTTNLITLKQRPRSRSIRPLVRQQI